VIGHNSVGNWISGEDSHVVSVDWSIPDSCVVPRSCVQWRICCWWVFPITVFYHVRKSIVNMNSFEKKYVCLFISTQESNATWSYEVSDFELCSEVVRKRFGILKCIWAPWKQTRRAGKKQNGVVRTLSASFVIYAFCSTRPLLEWNTFRCGKQFMFESSLFVEDLRVCLSGCSPS